MRLASNLTSLSRCATYDFLWSLVNVSAVAPEHLISQVFCQTSRLLDDIKVLLSDFGYKYFKKKFSALPFCFTKTFYLMLRKILFWPLIKDSDEKSLPLTCLACWILGNLANSSLDVRSYLLRSNVVQLILNLQKFDEIADEQFMGTQSWALGCLLQGKNPPASHSQAIRSLPRLLFMLETCNEKIKLDVLKALTSFTDFSGEL